MGMDRMGYWGGSMLVCGGCICTHLPLLDILQVPAAVVLTRASQALALGLILRVITFLVTMVRAPPTG